MTQGKLDWITCWSSQLPQLRKALGQHLGVTTLPSGPIGQATPITRLQVWALGRNSSARQQRDSLKLLAFMVEPWAQNNPGAEVPHLLSGESPGGPDRAAATRRRTTSECCD